MYLLLTVHVLCKRDNLISVLIILLIHNEPKGSFCNSSTGSGCVDPDAEGPLSSGDGQFLFPQGIAVDRSGNVYVADIFNNRIEVFALPTDTTVPDTTITSMIDGNG